jgi:hypothetical protein
VLCTPSLLQGSYALHTNTTHLRTAAGAKQIAGGVFKLNVLAERIKAIIEHRQWEEQQAAAVAAAAQQVSDVQ